MYDHVLKSLEIENTSILKNTVDPTTIKAVVYDCSGFEFVFNWIGVKKFDFAFDGNKKVYSTDRDEEYFIIEEDKNGLEEWAYDEITSYNDKYLQHEILLHSGAKIKIVCNKLILKRRRFKNLVG
ncbi:hypothetical protein [Paenibacillus daejeonensis]|uniref:hypothetical protein n=1 Tax=Paenibacillus daejeonensis TaxID=135193 RepID=UPI00146AECF6|nr:hypothetical protein [Paenibacillus daejeonensis]